MKISIRWALILGCLGLVWVTQAMITTSSYLSSQRVLTQHAHDIMENIADLTMEQSQNHLALAQGAAHLTKRLIASNVVGSEQQRQDVLERYFLDQLAIYPHFAGIYVGLPNGDFFFVNRSEVNSPGGFRTKIISHGEGRRQVKLLWRDREGMLLGMETDPDDAYDPRQRPWYRKVQAKNAIVWTDPYVFFTSQKPGITIAGPIHQSTGELKAVVGVDIEIDHLSTFIGKLRIGKHGRAFMLNNNGDVVAFPDLTKIRFSDQQKDGSIRLVKIDELDDPLSRAAYGSLDWKRTSDGRLDLNAPQFGRFKHDGETYLAMFTPFQKAEWPWIIGVYLPEDDYLGSIKDNRSFNILLTLAFSVIATLIGLRFARSIIRPVANLEKEALAVKEHDLTTQFDTRSPYKEIQETADSFSRMKENILAGEEKYRSIFENIQDVYYEASFDGTILEISPSITGISSYMRSELIGAPMTRLYPEDEDYHRMIEILRSEGRVDDYEIILSNKAGKSEYCSINAAVKHGEDGAPEKIIGSLRIVTDRKMADIELHRYKNRLEDLVRERTQDLEFSNDQLRQEIDARLDKERELRSSEEKYRSIIENMVNGYYEMDLEGHLTFLNEPLAQIMDYRREELIGRNARDFIDPETFEEVTRTFGGILQTGRPEKWSRYRFVRRDGKIRTLEGSAALIRDNDGNAVGFRGVVIDISNRLQAEDEKKKLEEQFHQNQRLEGIGTLAGGVAHDFNNLLMAIQGNVSLMRLKMEPDDANVGKLKSIESCVTAGADLTRQLLGFARGGKYRVQTLDFNGVIRATTRMFQRTRKDLQVRQNLQPGLWPVRADRSQAEEVMMNLLINAWQAMEDGGTITLETRNRELDEHFVKTYDISPGRYVHISVADTGCGMDETTRQKVFEPFYTTKEIGRGTGLGLAAVFGIVQNHDGVIDFETRPGAGTTFHIYLPAVDVEEKVEIRPLEKPVRGGETILLVDDEAAVRDVTQPMLEAMGYHVIVAEGGREAVEIFRKEWGRIDLVMLDMTMPDLSGGAVFDQMKEIHPDVTAMLSTGYSISDQAEKILARGCAGSIQKPYTLEQLRQKIQSVLEGKTENRYYE